LINTSNGTAKEKGLDSRVRFIEDDFMGMDLSAATVVLGYILASASAALRPKFENELKPGTRVVMEKFPVPGWKPAAAKEVSGRSFYLYVMPPEKTDDYDTASLDTAYESDWFYWP
jgi:hypothetical protein